MIDKELIRFDIDTLEKELQKINNHIILTTKRMNQLLSVKSKVEENLVVLKKRLRLND